MRQLRPMRSFLAAVFLCALAACQTTSTPQFANPAPDWQTRAGQLAYSGAKMSLIGEMLIRSSTSGDFELTFSKGPGVTLLLIRQNAKFARASGPLARGSWSGPIANAPARLRGWFSLKEKIIAGGSSIRVSEGGDSFNLQF